MKPFPNHARVCFVGDSITHEGVFLKHIVSYYRTHLPDVAVEFYNCGIAGGNLGNTIRVFEEDIAIYEPTHIVLMIGVNDSRRGRLSEPPSRERYEKLLAAYHAYGKNLERFYEMTRERGIELILCTPVPYAEYQETDITPAKGGYALIQGYAAYVQAFACRHGLALCDYHGAMTEAMQTETLYLGDCVHPTPRGHACMAKAFLAAQGLDYEGEETFSDDLEEWYTVTKRIRNLVAAEFLIVPDFAERTDADRRAVIEERLSEANKGTYTPDDFFRSLMEDYVKYKSHQREYVEYVKRFMKR